MIIVVIGQSGAGKTTFVKETFMRGETHIVEDIVPYTQTEEYAVVGKYYIGKRTEGTDTLSYNSQEKIRQLVQKLVKEGKNVILEGDRINNRTTFAFLSMLKVPVKMFLVTCRLETSMLRLRSAGSEITETFVKATRTKSHNNFKKWKKRFNGEVVVTDAEGSREEEEI